MMGLIAWFKEKIRMLFKTDAEKAFGVESRHGLKEIPKQSDFQIP